MPRVALTVQQVTRTALTPTMSAADSANGHQFSNDGNVWLEVTTTGTTANLTILTPGTVDGLAIADRVIALPATGSRKIGPFPPDVYNQADGNVYVDLSAQTGITLGVFRH